ncbi:MAG: outer membrane beta-barrel protein [Thermoanaerobaculia bacterium]
MKKRIFLFVSVMILPIFCGAQESRFEISPFWGYLFGGDVLKNSEDSPVEIRVAYHSTYGIRVAYDLSRKLAIELQVSRNDSELRDSRYSLPFPFRADYYLAYGKLLLATEPVQPYVALGAGDARLDTAFAPNFSDPHPTFNPPEIRNRFTGSLALGVGWFFSHHLGVRLDARLYATDIHDTLIGAPCTAFEPNSNGALVPTECPGKNWLLSTETSGGIVLRF